MPGDDEHEDDIETVRGAPDRTQRPEDDDDKGKKKKKKGDDEPGGGKKA